MEESKVAQMQERRVEIGQILNKMRQEVKRSISECAELIGISRQRYRHIELGETDISVVQLEALCQFLNLPLGRVLPQVQFTPPISPILLQTEQGQTVRLIVQLVT